MRLLSHLCFAALAGAALFACVAVLCACFQLVGQRSLGFSMVSEGFVNSIGIASPFHMWDRIVAVDGEPVWSKDDVLAQASQQSTGAAIVYRVERLDGSSVDVPMHIEVFTTGDLVRGQSGLAFLGLLFVVISILLYVLRPGTREAWAFFAVFAAIGVCLASVVDMTLLWRLPPLYLIFAPSLGTLGIILVVVIAGSRIGIAGKAAIAACVAVGALLSALLMTNRRDIHRYVIIDGVFYWWMAACTAAALVLLAVAYFRSESPDRRARMRQIMWTWPLGAGLPIANLLIGHSLLGVQTSLIWNAFLLLVPLSTADAIVRHDLLLLNHRARRVVASITIAVAVGVVLGLLLWGAAQFLQLSDAAATTALAALLFALAAPLTHRLQSRAEEILRSRRYDAARIVMRFSARASTSKHIADVLGQLDKALQLSIAPVRFEVFRYERREAVLRGQVSAASAHIPVDRSIKAWLDQAGPIVVDERNAAPAAIRAAIGSPALAVRLGVANEAVGLLVVSVRRDRVPYEETDVSFVAALAGPLAAALVNAVAYEDVERLNRELEARVAQRTVELEEKNQRLAALDLQKDELLASVSHDFRSPLSIIRGAVQAMLNDLGRLDIERMRTFLEAVDRQEHRLTSLCQSLLDLAKFRQPRRHTAPIDVAALAQRLVDDLALEARRHGVELALSVEDDANRIVYGDADRVERALHNLVDNALKFTPRDGRVEIRLLRSGDATALRLEVRDTGCGVPADAIPRLFEPFFQVPGSERSSKGTGLGLAIVKTLVESHGGRVDVTSELGRGTLFAISLPGGQS